MSRWLAAVLIMLGAVLGGCSPKRIASDGGVVVSAQPPPNPVPERVNTSPTEVAEQALPAPKPFSRAGANTPAQPRPQPTALGPQAVNLAKAQLGKPYQWGAAGPNKFDCSGLVQYVYSNLGVALPRVSGQQAGSGVHVDRADLRPGDLVFFRLSGTRIDHVGIYVGQGKFIHAPRKHNPVRMDSLNNSWWRRKFKGGRRVG